MLGFMGLPCYIESLVARHTFGREIRFDWRPCNLALRGLPRGDERELIESGKLSSVRAFQYTSECMFLCEERETDMHVDSKGQEFELWVLDKGPGRIPGSWTRARAMWEHTACRHMLPLDVS
jgi:hypothetical protein